MIKQHEKYLGLPSLMGRNKKASFSDIKDKLSKKLAGWKGKLLSKAGKEVLIKVVAQVIPTYTMSCFKIPDSLCDDLTSMIWQFWWGQRREEKKMEWLSWEKLCELKECGGIGFKQINILTWLCELSKAGSFKLVTILYSTGSSRPNIFPLVTFYTLPLEITLHTRGVAFYWLNSLLSKV